MVEWCPHSYADMNAAFSEIDNAMEYIQREAKRINARQLEGGGWSWDTSEGEASCEFVGSNGDDISASCITYTIDEEL